jgi:hypothetical protein
MRGMRKEKGRTNGGLLSLLRGMKRSPPVKNRSERELHSKAGNDFDLAQIGEQLKAD